MNSLNIKALLILACAVTCADASVPADPWGGQPKLSKPASTQKYTATMHHMFGDISNRYDEGGDFYYSNFLNSSGLKEALNTEQEVVFCGANDISFNEMIADIQNNLQIPNFNDNLAPNAKHTLFEEDASTTGIPPSYFNSSVYLVLKNNANATAKGRFCYDLNNKSQKVSYKDPGAEKQVYCDPSLSSPQVFMDPVSGFSCSVSLNAPLKVGKTKYLTQQQELNSKTVASAFAGCYKNAITGNAEFKLVANPPTCSKENRSACNSICDWAYKQVCTAQSMPRWGGGSCGAVPTMIFTNDFIQVSSSPSSSFDKQSGVQYQGTATMRCELIGNSAKWVIQESNCAPVSSGQN